MATCTICGEALKPEQKVCDICGTSVPATSAAAAPTPSTPPSPPPLPKPAPPMAAATSQLGLTRVCPVCQLQYGPEYADEFCGCGGELVTALPAAEAAPLVAEIVVTPPLPPQPAEAQPDEATIDEYATVVTRPTAPVGTQRPVPGTVCLVVYSEDKQPIHYCAIDKDVTIIGRSDPVRGDFPDLDLGEFFDTSVSRRISRKHAMVLRSRTAGTYSVRPLGGNTGTQIEKDLATQLQDYPLTPGTRMVLGGVVRLKFEVIS